MSSPDTSHRTPLVLPGGSGQNPYETSRHVDRWEDPNPLSPDTTLGGRGRGPTSLTLKESSGKRGWGRFGKTGGLEPMVQGKKV